MCVEHQASRPVAEDELPLSLRVVPTHNEVFSILRSSKNNKGHGEDSLPGELFKHAAKVLAERLWPLWLKATLRLQEPLAWKGGMLSELLKSYTAPVVECASFRGVLVSDASAKHYHTWVRGCMLPEYEVVTRNTQFGDIKHRGTDFCSHFVR